MNINIRPSNERGYFDHGWLKTHHTFSFGDYYDSRYLGFRSLRVINEDDVAPSRGFGMHPHRDMEILTYVTKGSLRHRDSMGNEGVVSPGMIQKMSAGSGVMHSEENASNKESVHLLQIWILPSKRGIKPSYEQTSLSTDPNQGLLLIASSNLKDDVIFIQQDVKIYEGKLTASKSIDVNLAINRAIWIQMVSGSLSINGNEIKKGDGVSIEDVEQFKIQCLEDSNFLLFDLA